MQSIFDLDSADRLVIGCWRLLDWDFSKPSLADFIAQCCDLGIHYFDHADIYGDYQVEHSFGRALTVNKALKERVKIVTKCGIKLVSSQRPKHATHAYDLSKHHIIQSVETSLKLLGIEQIDTLLIHRPSPLMNPAEVAETFSDLAQQGKVLHFGVANFQSHEFELLQSQVDQPLVTNQIELSLLHRDALFDGTITQCQKLGLRPMAWSPLAGGKIFSLGEDSKKLQNVLTDLCEELGCSVDQLALAWLLKHPASIIPITGSGNIDRIKSATLATKLTLSHDQWFQLLQAAQREEIP